MTLTEIWTVELKNGILGGLQPTCDPFDNTCFYIADGWGAAYPSMKLRQLSFENGKELHAVSIKNSVRCLYFNPDETNLFAVSDSKIFQINRKDFSLVRKFEKGVPKYSDFVSSNDADTLLLMNANSDFLFVYNYMNEKGTKKKVKSCSGIVKENENTYFIFSPKNGSLQHYDLKANTLTEISQTEVFYKSYKSNAGNIYLHSGKIVAATSNTHERIEPVSKIEIYPKSDVTHKTVIEFDFSFDTFVVSENEEKLYLINNNAVAVYSISEKKIIGKTTLMEKARIIQVFDKQHVLLSYEYDKPNVLTCWKF